MKNQKIQLVTWNVGTNYDKNNYSMPLSKTGVVKEKQSYPLNHFDENKFKHHFDILCLQEVLEQQKKTGQTLCTKARITEKFKSGFNIFSTQRGNNWIISILRKKLDFGGTEPTLLELSKPNKNQPYPFGHIINFEELALINLHLKANRFRTDHASDRSAQWIQMLEEARNLGIIDKCNKPLKDLIICGDFNAAPSEVDTFTDISNFRAPSLGNEAKPSFGEVTEIISTGKWDGKHRLDYIVGKFRGNFVPSEVMQSPYPWGSENTFRHYPVISI